METREAQQQYKEKLPMLNEMAELILSPGGLLAMWALASLPDLEQWFHDVAEKFKN